MRKSIHFAMLTIMLALLAFFLQSQTYLNGDVAYLLHVSKLLISGGTYITDFYETNPPMILFIYAPVAYISQVTHFDPAMLMRIYIILLALLSIACCYHITQKIFKSDDNKVASGFLYTLLFVFLFLPANEFGQREHIYLLLSLPYFLCAILRTPSYSFAKISYPFAILIGIIAAVGVGLKPFFLIPIILVELFLMFYNRKFFTCLRVETITFAIVLSLYLISVIVFHPLYIQILLPLISDLYFISTQESWTKILIRPSVIFCIGVSLSVFLFYSRVSFSRNDCCIHYSTRSLVLSCATRVCACLLIIRHLLRTVNRLFS